MAARRRQCRLHQTTRFPEDGTVEFTVETDRPVESGLKIRTPQWLAAPMTAKLNGEAIALLSDSLHWSSLRRQWKTGDRLTVSLPMRLWVSRLDPKKDYPAAVLCGPVVLAARAADPGFVEKLDLKHLDRELTPAAGESLTWRLAGNPAMLLRPFYVYKEGEPYFLYLDPAAARYIPHKAAHVPDGLEPARSFISPTSSGRRPNARSRGPAFAGSASSTMTPAERR